MEMLSGNNSSDGNSRLFNVCSIQIKILYLWGELGDIC